MKEAYFTTETIEKKAQEIFQELTALRNQARRFNPQSSALLVLDMQRYFLEPSSHASVPSAAAILPGLRQLVLAYQTGRLPIIFTRHLNTLQDAGQMANWWRDLIEPGDPCSLISADFNPAPGSVIEKSQYDAFFRTDLEENLRRRNVRQVVVCGVMTHLCCETTARSAFMRGFEVFFTVDGTATYTEAHHRAALLNLAHGFATPVLIYQLMDDFGARDAN